MYEGMDEDEFKPEKCAHGVWSYSPCIDCGVTGFTPAPKPAEPKPAAPACPECVKFYGEFATYHCKHKEPKPAEPEALLREFWISKHEHEILEHEPDCLELYIHVREVPK